MATKSKKYLVIGTLALAMLFCGPATTKLLAWGGGPHVSFYGSFPVPGGNVVFSNGYPYYGYPGSSPVYAPYGYPYYPYRMVRVFVRAPYPHWVNRRVYAPRSGHRGNRRPY
jgi:hypothetical protein